MQNEEIETGELNQTKERRTKNVKTKQIKHIGAALLLLSTLHPQLSTVFAQGSLTPPGAPAPTMKTLAQIEPRTPISSAAYTINVPGSYYLTTNLTVATGNAITIATNGVTLDLSGFTIASTANPAGTSSGILLNSGLRNITILNGFIQGGVTNNGSGVYSGSGFAYGIYYSGTSPFNMRVGSLSVSGCLYYGIYLGNSAVVESCAVYTVGSYGIRASTVNSSLAWDCGSYAISGSQVSGCRADCSGSADGISATTAQNCYGSSMSGNGVAATTAQNCYGSSSSGKGLSATIAQNCFGSSSSGYGLYAYQTAIGCYGFSNAGTGLYAYIANSCRGETISGTPQTTTYKYNMP
jgi:hypothetical protein